MTAAELIIELQKFPASTTVAMVDSDSGDFLPIKVMHIPATKNADRDVESDILLLIEDV